MVIGGSTSKVSEGGRLEVPVPADGPDDQLDSIKAALVISKRGFVVPRACRLGCLSSSEWDSVAGPDPSTCEPNARGWGKTDQIRRDAARKNLGRLCQEGDGTTMLQSPSLNKELGSV